MSGKKQNNIQTAHITFDQIVLLVQVLQWERPWFPTPFSFFPRSSLALSSTCHGLLQRRPPITDSTLQLSVVVLLGTRKSFFASSSTSGIPCTCISCYRQGWKRAVSRISKRCQIPNIQTHPDPVPATCQNGRPQLPLLRPLLVVAFHLQIPLLFVSSFYPLSAQPGAADERSFLWETLPTPLSVDEISRRNWNFGIHLARGLKRQQYPLFPGLLYNMLERPNIGQKNIISISIFLPSHHPRHTADFRSLSGIGVPPSGMILHFPGFSGPTLENLSPDADLVLHQDYIRSV